MSCCSKKSSNLFTNLLALADSALAILVFSPLVVGYWRGCWQLMDNYLFPQNPVYSVWASTSIGIGFGVFFGLFQNCFAKAFRDEKHKPLYYAMSRLYTTAYCFSCVNHWRGIWMFWDTYHNVSWQSGAISTGIGLLTLSLTRGVRNLLAPPYLIFPDYREGYFRVPTLFNTKESKCGCHCFILDVFFSIVFTGSLVVFVWRGTWIFLDRTLFPHNPSYSAWGSLVVGFSVTVLSFMSQVIMIPCLNQVKKGFLKILLEDFYFIVCFLGDINIWRGIWNVLNIYLYPDRPILSNFITALTGNVIMMGLFCANSIPVRGAQMDGAKEGSAGITFDNKYLRAICKAKEEPAEKPAEKPDIQTLNLWKTQDQLHLHLDDMKTLELFDRGAGGGDYSIDFKDSEKLSSDFSQSVNTAVTSFNPYPDVPAVPVPEDTLAREISLDEGETRL